MQKRSRDALLLSSTLFVPYAVLLSQLGIPCGSLWGPWAILGSPRCLLDELWTALWDYWAPMGVLGILVVLLSGFGAL